MNPLNTKIFTISDWSQFELKNHKTSYEETISKKEGEELLAELKSKLKKLQEKLYADQSKSLLIVLQAMDAAGKDSLIEHVFSGVNPQGCEVSSFKVPSDEEYSHDFLWRHYQRLPGKGKIGIFNRSHYENVLVCKVHPEYNLSEKVWKDVSEINDDFWKSKYESIRHFEKHLSENGTTVIKFFLNVSKEEQKSRFLDRIADDDKNWKFSSGDLKERARWDDYQKYYEEAIKETSREYAPWHVLPADKKWFTRVAAIQIIIETLEKMDLQYPVLPEDEKNKLIEAKAQLERE